MHHFKHLSNFMNTCFCNIDTSSQSKEKDKFTTYLKLLLVPQTLDSVLHFSRCSHLRLLFQVISSCRKFFCNSRCPLQPLLSCWKGFVIHFFTIGNTIINYCLHKVDSTNHRAETKQEASKGRRGKKQKYCFNSLLRSRLSLIVLIYKQERSCLISVSKKRKYVLNLKFISGIYLIPI